MLFNSVTFFIFLAIVLPLYYRLKHRGQNWMLLAASYVFYGWWDVRFLGLLIGSSVFDYYCGIWIENESRPKQRKWLLTGSIVVNMGVLCTFKYFNFFADSLQKLLGTFGQHASFPTLHVILPLGISFYTFLSMSYTFDVYRGELKARRNAIDYLLFVAFFPHLVAGPIVRASYLLPQCARPRTIKSDEVIKGFWLILLGLFKKVGVVIDWPKWWTGVSRNHSRRLPMRTSDSLFTRLLFKFADFSGYSDIARGLAKLMGFELVENFKAPYLVTNPPAFWSNWHISLSTWLRDYSIGRKPMQSPSGFLHSDDHYDVGRALARSRHRLYSLGILSGNSVGRASPLVATLGKKKESTKPQKTFFAKVSQIVLVVIFFHLTCIGWLFFRAGAAPTNFSQLNLVKNY